MTVFACLRCPMRLATLRSKVESALAGRVPSPFTYRDRKIVETVSAGIPEIDSLAGGLPRGSLTEICGPPCSGRTSLLLSALAARTAQAEVCALVDGRDAFDPHSAEAAGVKLKNLLWVRCRNMDQSLRATDLLLQGGGFGLIALDLSDIPPETVRYVPLNAWFRFRRAVEDTATILLLLEQESNAKTALRWFCGSARIPLIGSTAVGTTADVLRQHPFACLLDGFQVRAEVLRSRIQAGQRNFCSVTALLRRRAVDDARSFRNNLRNSLSKQKQCGAIRSSGLPAEPKPK